MGSTITITNGKGLTHALKQYAKDNGYDVSNITSKNWQDTIKQLEEIQKNREENNEASIYTNTGTQNNWHNKMVVKEGNIDFSDNEMDSLLQSMGLEISKQSPDTSKATAFNNWINSIAMNPAAQIEKFQVKADGSKTADEYNADLKNISTQYIKLYDTNGDNMISFDEYWAQEVKDLGDISNLSDDDKIALDNAKITLKASFDKMNVDNEEQSKNKLDIREVMNFFFTMDSSNEETVVDGYIEKDEFNKLNNGLRDTSTDADSYGNVIKSFLSNNFNAIFKNFKF